MSQEIQGLSCAACKLEITREGCICTACQAPHHVKCWTDAGCCASCSSAKGVRPFAVTGRSSLLSPGPWVWVALVTLLVSVGLILGDAGLVKRLPFLEMLQRPWRSRPHPHPVPAVASRCPASEEPCSPDGEAGRPEIIVNREIPHPGWRAGSYVGKLPAVVAFEWAEINPGPGRYRDLLLALDHRSCPFEKLPQEIEVQTALVREGSQAGPREWTSAKRLASHLPRQLWQRIHSDVPFNRVRLKLARYGHDVRLSDYAALEADPPPGEAIDCLRELVLERLDGDQACLASRSGARATVPAEFLSPFSSPNAVAITEPGARGILRMATDGTIGVWVAGGSSTWGHSLSSFVQPGNEIVTAGRDFGSGASAFFDGIGAWTLFSRFAQPAGIRRFHDAAIQVGFTVLEDGRVAIDGQQGRASLDLRSIAELEALLESREVAASKGVTGAQYLGMQHDLARFGLGEGSALQEFRRFAREEVLPGARSALEPPAARAGDRYVLSFLLPVGETLREKSMPVVMLDRAGCIVRLESREPGSRPREVHLPSGLLPPAPPVRVGDRLALYRLPAGR